MQLNNFIWNTFKESDTGRSFIHTFQNLEKIYRDEAQHDRVKAIFNNINDDQESSEFKLHIENILALKRIFKEDLEIHTADSSNSETTLQLIWSAVYADQVDKEDPDYVFSVDNIPDISVALYMIDPSFFFPYYFIRSFYLVEKIFAEFNIYLPPVPKKNDMQGRFFYYLELCKSLQDFASRFDMDSAELAAFIYGFATQIIEPYKNVTELPEPRKAFFVGGGKSSKEIDVSGDFAYLDNATDEDVYNWQGNPETEPGDIIVMYCLSPRSEIHSIWRAVTPGSIDPFFHYYRNVNIGFPTKVSHIPLAEIKSDPVLSTMPLVKGNMQGINGRPISKKYYDQILHILEEKGFDTKSLPSLQDTSFDGEHLKNERDVEKQLLEPLLKNLGYSEDEWLRQMTLRMGRGEKVYPDYVIHPQTDAGDERGQWVWEAKYSIHSHSQLKTDFDQAKSYALRLRCKGIGLVSKEGIWIATNDFDFDDLIFYNWTQLKERDTLNKVYDLVK